MNITKIINPTQLFIGPKKQVGQKAVFLLKKIFFNHNEDCKCTGCSQISNQKYPNVVFLQPTGKNYLISDFDIIFEKTKFKLEKNEFFFFIITEADLLTPASANRLLKILEEPPTGYHFLLLAENENNILPTIKSRSVITRLFGEKQEETTCANLLHYFLNEEQRNKPFEFESDLKKIQPSPSEAVIFIWNLIQALAKKEQQINDSQTEEKNKLKQKIEFLIQKLHQPPGQGSSSLFLKNIFINMP